MSANVASSWNARLQHSGGFASLVEDMAGTSSFGFRYSEIFLEIGDQRRRLSSLAGRHAETPKCWVIEYKLDSNVSYNSGHMIILSANIHDLSANVTKCRIYLEFKTPAFRGFLQACLQEHQMALEDIFSKSFKRLTRAKARRN